MIDWVGQSVNQVRQSPFATYYPRPHTHYIFHFSMLRFHSDINQLLPWTMWWLQETKRRRNRMRSQLQINELNSLTEIGYFIPLLVVFNYMCVCRIFSDFTQSLFYREKNYNILNKHVVYTSPLTFLNNNWITTAFI